jgi:phosphotriesterase-related protein
VAGLSRQRVHAGRQAVRDHVETVLGPVRPRDLGPTLMHEHLLVDTRTAADKKAGHAAVPLGLHNYYLARRNNDHPQCLVLDSVSDAVDELAHFAAAGGRTVVEVTPVGLGRNPAGLVEISAASGVQVVMGAGFYDHDYHTDSVHELAVEQLAELIVADCEEGVGAGQVKAGVIGEIGLSWPATDCEHKALTAAAKAQARTGRLLVVHPGRDPAAPRWALDRAEDAGADPARVALAHLDRTLEDPAAVAELARRGAYVSFDLFGSESSFYPYSDFAMPNDAGRLRLIRSVADLGQIAQVLVSHDIYAKTHLMRYGGEGYAHILRDVVPVMDRFGIDAAMRRQLLVDNPAAALSGGAAKP